MLLHPASQEEYPRKKDSGTSCSGHHEGIFFSLLFPVLCLATLMGKDKSAPDLERVKVVVLESYQIKDSPIISFAIEITVYSDPKTTKVSRIFIARVLPNTDAENAGCKPATRS